MCIGLRCRRLDLSGIGFRDDDEERHLGSSPRRACQVQLTPSDGSRTHARERGVVDNVDGLEGWGCPRRRRRHALAAAGAERRRSRGASGCEPSSPKRGTCVRGRRGELARRVRRGHAGLAMARSIDRGQRLGWDSPRRPPAGSPARHAREALRCRPAAGQRCAECRPRQWARSLRICAAERVATSHPGRRCTRSQPARGTRPRQRRTPVWRPAWSRACVRALLGAVHGSVCLLRDRT